jgi:hypothetical protein
LEKTNFAFYIVAPAGQVGLLFFGDRNKFIGTALHESTGSLKVGVVFAEKEQVVTLHGYAATKPMVSVIDGKFEPMDYDATTGHFSVEVMPTGLVDRSAADPVRI